MTTQLTMEQVSGALKEYGSAEQVRKNRIRVNTDPQKILSAIKAAQQFLDCDHLILISCTDDTGSFGLTYHLTGPHRTIISLAVSVPRESPQVFSVSDILPPAAIYERQIHDLFGIVFSGHPGLTRLMLNEDWPDGEYPLRKDWKPNKANSYGGAAPEGA
ncbi:NADH-quinone oxidoreductase subunit C [Methanoregula formicica]|uniref:NADH:ubiquinone oxidoreductase 27 kD subunit n=1 Tax=Methanoregula formicica (strain DSM 22288 / NBRC 105244 / SMSP) TaxID=593750 RepID=L0HDS3_METFS|nr:NADH-quinone oxidoreductase subunit C [Methanoregula formicica]AGB01229.1 NADH:ubiquinone oxidoreductase 27 kD subunit [Methanoregula formicica SMSP]